MPKARHKGTAAMQVIAVRNSHLHRIPCYSAAAHGATFIGELCPAANFKRRGNYACEQPYLFNLARAIASCCSVKSVDHGDCRTKYSTLFVRPSVCPWR